MAIEHDLGIKINIEPGTNKAEFKRLITEKYSDVAIPINISISTKEAKRKINELISYLSTGTKEFAAEAKNLSDISSNFFSGKGMSLSAVSNDISTQKSKLISEINETKKLLESKKAAIISTETDISKELGKIYKYQPEDSELDLKKNSNYLNSLNDLRSAIKSTLADIDSAFADENTNFLEYSKNLISNLQKTSDTLNTIFDISGMDHVVDKNFAGEIVQRTEDQFSTNTLLPFTKEVLNLSDALDDLSSGVETGKESSVAAPIYNIRDAVAALDAQLSVTAEPKFKDDDPALISLSKHLSELEAELASLNKEAVDTASAVKDDVGQVNSYFIGISKEIGIDSVLKDISLLQEKLLGLNSLSGDQAYSQYVDNIRKSVIDLQQSLSATVTNFKVSDVVGDPVEAKRVSEILTSSLEVFKTANSEISKSAGRGGLAEGLANMGGALQNVSEVLSTVRGAASGEDVTLAKTGDAISGSSKEVLAAQDAILKALANMSTAQRMYNIEVGRTKDKLLAVNAQILANKAAVKECISELQKFNTAATISTSPEKPSEKLDTQKFVTTGVGTTIKIASADAKTADKFASSLEKIQSLSSGAATGIDNVSTSLEGQHNSLLITNKALDSYVKNIESVSLIGNNKVKTPKSSIKNEQLKSEKPMEADTGVASVPSTEVIKVTKSQVDNLKKATEASSVYKTALEELSKNLADFNAGPMQKVNNTLKEQKDKYIDVSNAAKAYERSIASTAKQSSPSSGKKISNKQIGQFAERIGSLGETVTSSGNESLISDFNKFSSDFDAFEKSGEHSASVFTSLSKTMGEIRQKTSDYAKAQKDAEGSAQKTADYTETIKRLATLETSLTSRSSQFLLSDPKEAKVYSDQAEQLRTLIALMKSVNSPETEQSALNIINSQFVADGVPKYTSLAAALDDISGSALTALQNASKFSATISADRSAVKAATDIQNLTFQIQRFLDQNRQISGNDSLNSRFSSLLQRLSDPSAISNVGELRSEFASLKTEAQSLGLVGDSLYQQIKKLFSTHFGTMLTMNAIHMLQNSFYQAYQNVVQLDDAMTELKRVTNETNDVYEKVIDNASQSALKYGATVSDVVNSTADFARLGYSLADSQTLADSATVYNNVGDGLNGIDEATQSIISTMKAFNIGAEESMKIVDEFNYTGNSFAITAGGVGQALEASASSLHSANNSLEESIGLITAANEVVQDPAKVGTAMKTISMYLRATKTNLEDAGESADGCASSVSELRDKILALTAETSGPVDIQLDENSYKSTFQILKEMSGVWSQMTDQQQAAATELMGGKRNGNVISALMNNFSTAEDVVKEATNSTGTAVKENEKYLESITGKLEVFQAAFQSLSNDVIDSDIIKGLLDLATAFIKLADGAAKAGAAFPAIAAGLAAYSQLGTISKDFRSATNLLRSASDFSDTKNLSSYLELGGDSMFNNIPILGSLFGSNSKYITRELGFKVNISNENKVQELANYFSTLSAQEQKAAKEIITFSDGMEDAFNNAIGKTKAQTVATNELVSAQERSARIMFGLKAVGTMAIAAGITYLIQKAFSYAEEQLKKLQTAAEQASTLVSENETKRASIKDLVSEYEQLGKSESGYVSNIETARSIQDQITEAIGNQANGLDLVNGKYDAQLKKLREITTVYSQGELSAYTEQVGATSDLLISKYKRITNKLLDNYAVMQTTIRGQRYGQVYGSASGNDKRASEILNTAGFSNRFSATSIGGGIGMGNYNFSALGVSKNADAEEIVAYYYKVSDAIDALMNSELGASATSTTLYKSLALTRDGLKEYVSNYESAVKQQMTAKAVNQVAGDMSGANISSGSDFVNYIQEIQSSTQYSDEYKQVLIDTARDAMPQFASAYQDMVDEVAKDDLGNYLKAASVDSQEAFNELWEGVQDSKVYTDDERAALESLIIETFPDFAEAAGVAADANDALANSSVSVIDMTSDEFKAISDNLDSVQNAYKTLSDAVTEYNDNGYMSIDTLQSVLSLGDNYLRYLIDENGQLSLNEEGLVRIANARLDELEAKALENAESLVDSFSSEATAADYLANSLENLAHSRMDDATALLAHQSAILAGLDPASSEYQTKKKASDMVIKSFSAEKGAIEKTRASLGKYTAATMGAASASKSLADSTNAAADAAEKEQNRLKIYGQAATKEIEKRIDKLNDEKSAFEDDIQAQIDNLNKLKDAQDKAYEDRVDQLNDEKDALGDKNDETDREIKLAELQQALAEAQSAKTKRMYVEGQGYIWTTDQAAIDEAQNNLDEQIRNNAHNDAIKAIEDEIDAINAEKDAYDDSVAAQIDDLNARKDAFDKNIEDQVDQLNALKDKYQEAIDLIGTSWDDYQTQLQAAAEFSKMSYEQMTSYSTSFKDQVVANMQAIKAASDEAATAQSKVGSGGSSTDTGKNTQWTASVYNKKSKAVAKRFTSTVSEDDARNQAVTYIESRAGTLSANYDISLSSRTYAIGSRHISGSQIGITQDAGNELLVRNPSAGQYTYLEDGDGVIPADITSRLFDMGANPSAWFAKELNAANILLNRNNQPTSITIGDIVVTNPVGNADDLANAIQGRFPALMLQNLTKR